MVLSNSHLYSINLEHYESARPVAQLPQCDGAVMVPLSASEILVTNYDSDKSLLVNTQTHSAKYNKATQGVVGGTTVSLSLQEFLEFGPTANTIS